ncbi:MAG: VacJ family lipoprotein [Alphaproteobacteria bacterium]
MKATGLALAMCLGMSGAAMAQQAAAPLDGVDDPHESFNRDIFEFNQVIDRNLLKPAAKVYEDVVPEFIRGMVNAFLTTLATPLVLGNELLQGEFDRAGYTVSRTVVNLVMGAGGIIDAAGSMGVPAHDEDFGQTMAVWGWTNDNPYLVLPLLGPSTIRDGIGIGVEAVFSPLGYMYDMSLAESIGKQGATALDKRSRYLTQLEELEKTSLDFYATLRSLYLQKRRDEIRNGEGGEAVPIPEITMDFDGKDMITAQTTALQ